MVERMVCHSMLTCIWDPDVVHTQIQCQSSPMSNSFFKLSCAVGLSLSIENLRTWVRVVQQLLQCCDQPGGEARDQLLKVQRGRSCPGPDAAQQVSTTKQYSTSSAPAWPRSVMAKRLHAD
jgi:hypothetical protein